MCSSSWVTSSELWGRGEKKEYHMGMKYVSEQIVLGPNQAKETLIKKARITDAKFVLGFGG